MTHDWQITEYDGEALKEEDKERYLGLKFLICGYRGVGEYFELLHEHRVALQGKI